MIVYNKEYNKKIRELCEKSPVGYKNVLNSKNGKYLMDYILSCVNGFLTPENASLGKMISWVLNELQDFPNCKTEGCTNKVIGRKNMKWHEQWQLHCCNKCAQNDDDIKKIVKQRKFEKYGNPNYNGDIEKLKENNRKIYGCDWYVQSSDFKNKAKSTWIEHGYDHPMHSEKIKKEMGDRYEEKYGVRYSILNHDVIVKSRKPYIYDNIYFKSSWELAFYIYLKDNNIPFTYQPDIMIPYIDESEKERYYLPDFIVNDRLVEIKGDQFVADNGTYINPYDRSGETNEIYEAKHKCMLENNVKIVSKEEMKKYLEYCQNKFGSYEWKNQFKVKPSDYHLIIPRNDGNLVKEFKYLRDKEADHLQKNQGSRNYIIKYFQQDTFFRKEKEIWKNDPEKREELILNRMKYLNKKESELTTDDILTGFKKSGIYYGYSHFNPLWFKWFIQKYGVKICYDPFGGWGHRLLGGLSLEKYIYNDLSLHTKLNVDRMIEYFDIKNTVTFNKDAKSFEPDAEFDAIFTCPPYFNVEEYECGLFHDISEYNSLILSIFRLFQRKNSCRIMGIVIRDDLLPEEMRNYSEKIDIISYKTKYLSDNDNISQEHMFIFMK